MSGPILFKHVYFASLNKTRNIFWGQKNLRSIFICQNLLNISMNFSIDTSGVNHFYIAFSTYLNIIRRKLVGQTYLRSKFLYLQIHEKF